MYQCDVCGNDATTTLYVESVSYYGDVYTFHVCSPECEREIVGAQE